MDLLHEKLQAAGQYVDVLGSILRMTDDPGEVERFYEAEFNRREFQEASDLLGNARLTLSALLIPVEPNRDDSYFDELEAAIPEDEITGELPDLDAIALERGLTHKEEVTLNAKKLMGKAYEAFNNAKKSPANELSSVLYQSNLKSMLYTPQDLVTTLSVWLADHDERNQEKQNNQTVYVQAMKLIEVEMRDNWRQDISPSHLVDFVRLYALLDLYDSKVSANILREYFKNPKKQSDRIYARRQLAFAALDLVDEPRALEKVLLIGNYQTDVLPPEGYLDAFLVATRLGVDDNFVIDDEQLKASWNANVVFRKLFELSDMSDQESQAASYKYLNLESVQQAFRSAVINATRLNGQKKMADRITILEKLTTNKTFSLTEDQFKRGPNWPLNIVLDGSDPLRKVYANRVESLLESRTIVKQCIGLIRNERPQSDPKAITIRIPGKNFSIDIVAETPNLLKTRLGQIIEQVQHSQLTPEITETLSNYDVAGLKITDPIIINIDDQIVMFWFRQHAQIEKTIHPIGSLESIGLPELDLPEGQTLRDSADQISAYVKDHHSIFLPPSGVRGHIIQEGLTQFGYSEARFRPDPEDSGNMIVSIEVGKGENTLVYEVVFNKDFEFDLKGFRLDSVGSRDFIDRLRVVLLEMVKDTICYEYPDLEPNLGKADPQTVRPVFIAAMGHLRFLANGHKPSIKAQENYVREVGNSTLREASDRRKEVFERNEDSTYVKRREPKNSGNGLPRLVRLGKPKIK